MCRACVRYFRPLYTPVVMITGWGAQVDPERLKQSGVDRVLAKPFQWPALLDTIHGLLE